MGGQGSGGKREGSGRPEGSTALPSKVVAVRLYQWIIDIIEKADGDYSISEWLKWVATEEADRLKKEAKPGRKAKYWLPPEPKKAEPKKKEAKQDPPKKAAKPKKNDDQAERMKNFTDDAAKMTDKELLFELSRINAQLGKGSLTGKGRDTAIDFLLILENEQRKRTPPKLVHKDVWALLQPDKPLENFASEQDAKTAAKALKLKTVELVDDPPRTLTKPLFVKSTLEENIHRATFGAPYRLWFKQKFGKPSSLEQLSLPGVSGRPPKKRKRPK